MRDGLRNQADFALGLTESQVGHYADAERSLLDALRAKPDDYAALYALGVTRLSLATLEKTDPDSAAPCFAEVVRAARESSGTAALHDTALRALRKVYAAKVRSQPFDQFFASQRLTMPTAPAEPASLSGTYAGSASCRPCHEPEFRNWKATGMANMFRPYSERDVIGRFSGEEIMAGNVRTGAENGQGFIELRNTDSGKWTRYRIDALIGSKWQQAYASLLPDGGLVVLPIQYSKLEGGWVNYWKSVDGTSERSDIAHFSSALKGNGAPEGSLYQRDCAPCIPAS